MNAETSAAPAWVRWEKHKHRGFVAIAILASALIAAAPYNERRLFLLPQLPFALAAIPAPEPTSLRSAIMGYLHDGCSPDLLGTAGFLRAVEQNDCGHGRKRTKSAPTAPEPAAFFAMPDDPVSFGDPLLAMPELLLPELSPEPVSLADIGDIGNRGYGYPIQLLSPVPPAVLSAIPEPASWALMLGGFGLIGGALRRRHVRVRFAIS